MSGAVNAAARLDRLPMGAFHHRMLWLIGLGMFFDSFDNTLMGSVLAALVSSHWSTLRLNSLFISSTFVGLTIGAAFAGWLGDRFGRRFAYQFNLAIFGSMALVSALAPSMHCLIAIRCVMGIGLGAEYVMGYGLITEFIPPRQRGRYVALLGLIAGCGVFVTAAVSVLVIPWLGWRMMFVIGGVGALWVWWLRRSLPESPRWLEEVGREAEAQQILSAIEQEASRVVPLPPVVVTHATRPRRVSIAILFTRSVLRRTLLAIVINVVCLFGSFSFTIWVPSFFVSQGMDVTRSLGFTAAMLAGFVAGPLLGVYIADRVGRRRGIVLCGLVCACMGATYPFLVSPIAIMLCGFLLVSSMALFLTLGLGGYTPELFPTAYRFRGSGLAQMTGRIGLIVAPFGVLALFDSYGVAGVVGVIAGAYLAVACLVAIFGIETNQKSLEMLQPLTTSNDEPRSCAAVSDNTGL